MDPIRLDWTGLDQIIVVDQFGSERKQYSGVDYLDSRGNGRPMILARVGRNVLD